MKNNRQGTKRKRYPIDSFCNSRLPLCRSPKAFPVRNTETSCKTRVTDSGSPRQLVHQDWSGLVIYARRSGPSAHLFHPIPIEAHSDQSCTSKSLSFVSALTIPLTLSRKTEKASKRDHTSTSSHSIAYIVIIFSSDARRTAPLFVHNPSTHFSYSRKGMHSAKTEGYSSCRPNCRKANNRKKVNCRGEKSCVRKPPLERDGMEEADAAKPSHPN